MLISFSLLIYVLLIISIEISSNAFRIASTLGCCCEHETSSCWISPRALFALWYSNALHREKDICVNWMGNALLRQETSYSTVWKKRHYERAVNSVLKRQNSLVKERPRAKKRAQSKTISVNMTSAGTTTSSMVQAIIVQSGALDSMNITSA